jgi:hypothetical protein
VIIHYKTKGDLNTVPQASRDLDESIGKTSNQIFPIITTKYI